MAVRHLGEPLDPGLPASPTLRIKEDRAGVVRGELALDLPQNGLASIRVALARLLFDQLVDLGIAVAVPVDARPAAVEQLQHRVGVGPTGLQVERDGEILAYNLRKILRRIDHVEFGVDVDVLQLVDQKHRRVAIELDIAGGHLDVDVLSGAVAELLHNPAPLGAVRFDVGTVTRQFLDFIWQQAPQSSGRRLKEADMTLALGDVVDKGLAVDAERHRAPELRIVERWLVVVDEQVPIDALARVQLADRLRHQAFDVLY